MGIRKVFFGVFLLSGSLFAKEIVWQGGSYEVRVLPKSVVAIDVPCEVRSVFVNDLVEADYSGRGVFIAVGEKPTSIGIACKDRIYSLYLRPSNGGSVYIKITDPSIQEKRVKAQEQEKVSIQLPDISAIEVLKSLMENQIPKGFVEINFQQSFSANGIEIVSLKAYAGQDMLAIIYKAQNKGYTQKRLTRDSFIDKDVLALHINKEGFLKSGEGTLIYVVKSLPKNNPYSVIPWK